MPIWLAIYLTLGAVAATIYGVIFYVSFSDLGESDWSMWAIAVGICVAMLFAWPLWLGGFLVCLALQKLGVIG